MPPINPVIFSRVLDASDGGADREHEGRHPKLITDQTS